MDNIEPEDEFEFGNIPSGMFPTPEEWAAKDAADQKRRVELADYFAAEFDEADPRHKPGEEQDINAQLEQLDRVITEPSTSTIRYYLGNPWIKPLAEIPPDKLEQELALLLEFMLLYGVRLDSVADAPAEVLYRFIVDELLDEEIGNMAGTGMTTSFIYEEFYPNDEYDAKFWASTFIGRLLFFDDKFGQQDEYYGIAKEGLSDPQGKPISMDEMTQMLGQFRARFSMVTDMKNDAIDCTLDGDNAVVNLMTSYIGTRAKDADIVKIVGRSTIWLVRSEYGGYDTIRAQIAGWDEIL